MEQPGNSTFEQGMAIELIPEVSDIMEFQPTGQQVLVCPHEMDGAKLTKGGIILPDNITAFRNNLLQRGRVVTAGSRCVELKRDMVVFYYNSAWKNSGACIRSGQELYYLMEEYSVKGYIEGKVKKTKVVKQKETETV